MHYIWVEVDEATRAKGGTWNKVCAVPFKDAKIAREVIKLFQIEHPNLLFTVSTAKPISTIFKF